MSLIVMDRILGNVSIKILFLFTRPGMTRVIFEYCRNTGSMFQLFMYENYLFRWPVHFYHCFSGEMVQSQMLLMLLVLVYKGNNFIGFSLYMYR